MSKGPKHTDLIIESLKKDRQILSNKCIKGGDNNTHLCSRVDNRDSMYCSVYAYPEAMWKNGDCLMADDQLRTTTKIETKRIRVGQQKSHRRKKRNRK